MSDEPISNVDDTLCEPLVVLVNKDSGAMREDDFAQQIERLFVAHDLAVEVQCLSGDGISKFLATRLGDAASCVVAAGGDGTVHLVASAILDTQHRLALLPIGTMNLFARSLDIPLILEDAVATIATGRYCPVDLCSVNERVVLTNASAGLYAEITAAREARRKRHRRWPRLVRWTVDTVAGFWSMARHWWRGSLTLRVDGDTYRLPTRLFSVSNNEYEGLVQTKRRRDGRLSVIIPDPLSPMRTLWTAVKVAFVGPRQVREVTVRLAREVDVLGKGSIKTVLDGEVAQMSLPLRIRPLPSVIEVRVPVQQRSPSGDTQG